MLVGERTYYYVVLPSCQRKNEMFAVQWPSEYKEGDVYFVVGITCHACHFIHNRDYNLSASVVAQSQ